MFTLTYPSFLRTNVDSPYYKLNGQVAHLAMKEQRVHAVRYQTKGDSKLRDFCGKLKTSGYIDRYFVNRFHSTCAIKEPRGKPVTIRSQEELFALFNEEDLLAAKIVIFGDDVIEEPADDSGFVA